jgi:hypothetical protein
MKKVLALVLLAATLVSCKQELQMKVTIISHAVTANKMGERTYSTVVRAEDGIVDEKVGLQWYAKPIGSTSIATVYREKK